MLLLQSEVDDTIRELKKIPGFNAFLILNNDGEVYSKHVKDLLFIIYMSMCRHCD
jgi:hypothetical protein